MFLVKLRSFQSRWSCTMTPNSDETLRLVRAPAFYCLGAFSSHILTVPLALLAGAHGENVLLFYT